MQDRERHKRLAAAANPRRAGADDATPLARLFGAAFANDPVFEWISRPGHTRAERLGRFFHWVLRARAIPFGEVWMLQDGSAAAAWLPPGVQASAGGFREQLRLLPMFLRLCGLARLGRGVAMADAMERHHPAERHYYLAFIAVAPRLQGLGLGSSILEATLRRADAGDLAAYLENSNPRNTRLYERHGFVRRKNVSPAGAPPLLAMWRPAAGGQKSEFGNQKPESFVLSTSDIPNSDFQFESKIRTHGSSSLSQ